MARGRRVEVGAGRVVVLGSGPTGCCFGFGDDGFRADGLRFGADGFRVDGLRFRADGFRVDGLRFRADGLLFWVWG
jgi:hypothetical protein